MIGSAYQAYQNNSIMTASPGELTLMLYNGAIKFCNQALEALESKNLEKANTYIIKVQKIIEELQVTLDKKYPVAKEMDLLYDFIMQLLIEGNIQKDQTKITQALEFIREFRDMWQGVIKH